MGAFSDWLEWQIHSHILGSGTYTKPTTIGVALTSNVCVDADTGSLSTGKELANAGSYARQALNPSATNWLDPVAANGLCENLVGITFPTATADWGWVSGVAICDSTTYGGGHMLYYGALTLPKLIGNGDQFKFNANDIQITLD